MILSETKKTIYRTMMFGSLLSFLITAASCYSTQNLTKKRNEKRQFRDSLYLAQKHDYFIESQQQNRDMPQGEIDH